MWTLVLPCFRGVARLEILNDLLHCIVGYRCAVGFYHLIHFVGPSAPGQRRLHRDVTRAMADIAVNLYLLSSITRRKHRGIDGVFSGVVDSIGGTNTRKYLANAPLHRRRVISGLEFSVEPPAGQDRQRYKSQSVPFISAHELLPLTGVPDDDFLSFDLVPQVPTRIPDALVRLSVPLLIGSPNRQFVSPGLPRSPRERPCPKRIRPEILPETGVTPVPAAFLRNLDSLDGAIAAE